MVQLVENGITLLREKGLRVTEQRKAILEVLASARLSNVGRRNFRSILPEKSCDLVTAYRCLNSLRKWDVVQRGVRENGTKVYCLGHGHGHHHHLTCEIVEERNELIFAWERVGAKRKIFRVFEITHVMEVFGIVHPVHRNFI